jgi:hypothetical protein
MEEAKLMGFSGGFEKGKLVTALLGLDGNLSAIDIQVKPKSISGSGD